jgi:hypothetical protein
LTPEAKIIAKEPQSVVLGHCDVDFIAVAVALELFLHHRLYVL